jgi:hypothetical protein
MEMYNLTVDEAHTFFVGDGEWLVHNTSPLDPACQTTLRAVRKDVTQDWVQNGLEVDGKKFTLDPHAEKKWRTDSARKDVMPWDVAKALSESPTPGTGGLVLYTNPQTGTWVAVDPVTNRIVQVAPASFGKP